MNSTPNSVMDVGTLGKLIIKRAYMQSLRNNRRCRKTEERQIDCDAIGKSWPWNAVRQDREQEWDYLGNLGVNEKVDDTNGNRKVQGDSSRYQVDQTQAKAFEEEPMQIRSRLVVHVFTYGDRPDLYAGAPPLEGWKAILSGAAHQKKKPTSQSCTSTCLVLTSTQKAQ